LQGGGSGIIENAGVDYILPYWMARYYGVITNEARVQSAAAPSSAVAPGSLASFYGDNLAGRVAQAGPSTLPASLCGVTPVGVDRPVYVSFYGTGIRNRSSPANVTATINGVSVPVLYAGAAPDFVGLDQVNTGLPLTLRGSGEVNVVLAVDGQSSNAVTIHI